MEGGAILFPRAWHASPITYNTDLSAVWVALRPGRVFLFAVLRFAVTLLVPFFKFTSVFGFALLVNMIMQVWSGILLSLYYVPDPAMVMVRREEYMNEVWWFSSVYKTHVVGVDSIFVLSYLHIYKKIYIKNFLGSDVDGWTSGTYAFLIYHVVVFLGITLSTSHLGDLTLTIAANIFWSLFGFTHEAYCIVFTNKHLNTDQLTRLMVAHYILAWYYTYLVQSHVLHIHETWDLDSGTSAPQDNGTPKLSWGLDAAQRECLMMGALYISLMSYFTRERHLTSLAIDYSFFEHWSDFESEDANYFIVGPHWYFRPHMGLLTICAEHYEGLFWLAVYYVLLALLPYVSRFARPIKSWGTTAPDSTPMRKSSTQQGAFVVFAGSMFYVCGTLPCARFYYEGEEGFFGNLGLRLAYQYLYSYLAVVLHWLDKSESAIASSKPADPRPVGEDAGGAVGQSTFGVAKPWGSSLDWTPLHLKACFGPKTK
jgi:quinol-cytochrome oxidoreductase complex cytochrome b subunit